MIQSAEKIKLHIKKQADEQGIHYNQMMAIVAYERAMLRLLQSQKLYDSFIFKGGIIMRMAYKSERYTSDLDASFENISYIQLKKEVEKFLSVDLKDYFMFQNGKWLDISENKDYKGLRFITDFYFSGSKVQSIQIDFTVSELKKFFVQKKFKTVFFKDTFSAKIYSPEMIIAEKLQTIVWRGESNTRTRDLYDINYLIPNVKKSLFKKSVNQVFKIRGTKIPDSFFNVISKQDTKKLKKSWVKYEKNLEEHDFHNLWKIFIKNLHKIDSLLDKN